MVQILIYLRPSHLAKYQALGTSFFHIINNILLKSAKNVVMGQFKQKSLQCFDIALLFKQVVDTTDTNK